MAATARQIWDDAARHYMAERARVVRRLGDVVADMNAQLKLEAVLDRIAASLRRPTCTSSPPARRAS